MSVGLSATYMYVIVINVNVTADSGKHYESSKLIRCLSEGFFF